MNRKIKTGINVSWILGIVFGSIGFIFIMAALIFLFFTGQNSFQEEEMKITALIFLVIGSIFFVIGLIFLIHQFLKIRKIRRVVEAGNYIYAQVAEFDRNYNISVNGRNPYFVRCRYQDSNGTIHMFRSRNLFYNPETILLETQVRVYVDKDNYKYYYVDIDEILPKVIEH